jgi:RNA-directed DNA polymerase
VGKKNRPWFASGGYKHFDIQVGQSFAEKTGSPAFVTAHSWSPLIKYDKRIKRYKPKNGKTVYKVRPIMYASHRDACILKRYARVLSARLNDHYANTGLDTAVIAYRALGKANYQFSADAYRFAKSTMPCMALCFDITGFFDHLDHGVLKERLKRVLGVKELSDDWYRVFRSVTQYRSIERDDLENNSIFGQRLKSKDRVPIAPIAQIIAAAIPIQKNLNKFGIPQGTPISSVFSNLYLLDFDRDMVAICATHGALYQRYSDDILIICPMGSETQLSAAVQASLIDHKLDLATDKTDTQTFGPRDKSIFQYLGFNISSDGAVIRPSSLARQWRKAKRAINATRSAGLAAISKGKTDKIYVSKLRRRFSPVGSRNFSSYARRADTAFQSKKISRQLARLERKIDAEIRALQKS